MHSPSRRTLLANCAVGTSAIVSIAGCLSDDGSSDSESDNASDEDGSESEDDASSSGGSSQLELDAEIRDEDEVLYTEDLRGRIETVVVGVVDENGEPVTDGRVLVEEGSAQLDTPQVAEIGSGTDAFDRSDDTEELASNQVGFGFTHEDEPARESEEVEYTMGLRSDQNQGTLEFEIFPPSDSNHTDSLRNSELIVIRGGEGAESDA